MSLYLHGFHSKHTQTSENSIITIHKNVRKATVNKLATLLKVCTAFFSTFYFKSCVLSKADSRTPGN
jgi:hypothetical protein